MDNNNNRKKFQPSCSTQCSNAWKTAEAEFNEMKNRLSELEGIVENYQTQTISKSEHEVRIASVEETCIAKCAKAEKKAEQIKEYYEAKFAELQAHFDKTKNECDTKISKAEHDARIAELEETYNRRLDIAEEQNEHLEDHYGARIADLKHAAAQNECNVELSDIVETHQKEKMDLMTKISHLTFVNADLTAKVGKFEEIQKIKTDAEEKKNQLSEVAETSAGTSSIVFCNFEDAFPGSNKYECDYEQLVGKVLTTGTLVQKENGLWYANEMFEILFEHQNFKVLPEIELIIRTDFDTIFNYVMVNKVLFVRFNYSKIAYVDVKRLIASCDNIERVTFDLSTVEDASGVIMEIDQIWKGILEINPYIKHVEYYFKDDEITSKTVAKLCELPPFPNVCRFCFYNLTENFDFWMFGEFIKKNPKAYYELHFYGTDEYYGEMKNIGDELLRALPAATELHLRYDNFYNYYS